MKHVSKLLSLLTYLLVYGASVDTYTVFVMKGDSVTLEYGIYVDPQEDEVTWMIHDYLIAKRGGYFRDICTDAQCKDRNERIRDRLKFNRNGSLTITNTTITDSGDYSISISFGRTGSGEFGGFYTVVVRGVFSVDTDGVSVMEGDSATLYSGVQIKQEEWIRWYFNNNTDNIARIAGDLSYNSAIFKYDQCSDSGNERFKYRPKLEHQTASLTITDIRTSDSGLYDLLITGLHSSSSSSSTKIFIVAVDGVPAAERQKMKRKSVKEGESVTLDPGVIKNPNNVMTWHFNDTLIAQITGDQSKICTDVQCDERFRDRLKLDHQNSSLTITDIIFTDSGVYKLKISSPRFSIIRSFSVTVTGFLGFGSDGVSVFVMEGDSVSLHTDVETNQQDRIRWYFNNIRIAEIKENRSFTCTGVLCHNDGTERFRERLKLDHQTGSLTITDIRTTDSGDYELQINSNQSDYILGVSVDGVPAAERQKMKRKSVKEGESVTLDPGVIKNPNNVMTWHFNDILIAQITGDQSKICTDVQCDERFRDRLKLDHQNSSLTITGIIFTDSGVYKLKISSPRFSIIRSFSVTVTGFLGFGSDGVSVFVMEGDSVSLHTDVETNQQDRIRWYFNNIRIAEIKENRSFTCTGVLCHNDGTERFRERLKLDHQTGSLTITDIRTTDSGDYELQINSNQSDYILGVSVDGVPAAERQKMKRKSVKEGESVTLDPGVIKNPNNVMTWHFNDILIAQITGDQSKICTDVQCDERFRDRLKLDHQNSSLTITDIIFTDSGVYKLKISSRRISIIRSFSVTVTAAVVGISASAVVVGVLLIIAAAAGLIYCCQRQARRKGTRRQSNDQVNVVDSSPNQNDADSSQSDVPD